MMMFSEKWTRRRGFTVFDLLISLAVIAVLLAVGLPAVQFARESARRTQCTNQLRQIGLAAQQYHAVANRLPAAWTVTPGTESGYGWTNALMSYMELNNQYSLVHREKDLAAIENNTARSLSLPTLLCPSDIVVPEFLLLMEDHAEDGETTAHPHSDPNSEPPLMQLPTANYVAVFGTIEADDDGAHPLGDGAIVVDTRVSLSDLENGTSQTLLIGERQMATVPSTWIGVDFRGADAGCRLVGAALGYPNCEVCDECEFTSRHRGGANFVWADGHVALVSQSIDLHTYQQMARRRTSRLD